MLRFIVPALAGLVLMVPSAGADDNKAKKKNKGPDLDAVFSKIDANKDGKLTPAEFAAAREEIKKKKDGEQPKNPAKAGKGGKMATAIFAKLDTNKDGVLSSDEFRKMTEVMKALKQEKKKDK